MNEVTVIIMAKECIPGRVKTRLHPPFSLTDAARIAQASLDDTIASIGLLDARKVLCVQGTLPAVQGFEQVAQTTGELDERIAAVLDQISGAVLLIGMDTPHLDPSLLRQLIASWPEEVDAWWGPATDGGFWLLGLRGQSALAERTGLVHPRGDLVRGVPMSRSDTGAVQRARLVAAGLRVVDVPPLTDIDDVQSLRSVSGQLAHGSALDRLLGEVQELVR